jgi:hypothetical protein
MNKLGPMNYTIILVFQLIISANLLFGQRQRNIIDIESKICVLNIKGFYKAQDGSSYISHLLDLERSRNSKLTKLQLPDTLAIQFCAALNRTLDGQDVVLARTHDFRAVFFVEIEDPEDITYVCMGSTFDNLIYIEDGLYELDAYNLIIVNMIYDYILKELTSN